MSEVIVTATGLRDFCRVVLAKSLPDGEAAIVADNLVDADLLGVHSHGVTRLPDYLKRMEAGLIEKKTVVTLVHETTTTALYDGGNGWGQVVASEAMQAAVNKALEHGTGFVGVRNSNHFGTASYYTRKAAEQGCIGIAMTNASASMVPFGAMEPSLGTNPISFAVPCGEGKKPVMLDMATSTVARGKIILANKNGASIPEGWAITVDGEPTTDPVKALAGAVLPFGGAKGSGLAIMVDILSGVLTGALFGKTIPRMYEDNDAQRLGHFFGAIDIEAFMGKENFYQRMQEKVDETVSSAPMKGFDRVYMPGEIELLKKQKNETEGVPISASVYHELEQAGLKYGVDMSGFVSSETKEER